MPDPSLPLFQLPKPSLRHLFIARGAQRIDFKGRGGGKTLIKQVERTRHATLLSRQLASVSKISGEVQKAILENELPEMEGIVVKITSELGYPLSAADLQALTTRTGRRSGPVITLLQAIQMEDEDGEAYTRIALHVPFGGLTYLEEKIRKFPKARE